MTDRDEEYDKIKMGRLVDDGLEDATHLFHGNPIRVSFCRWDLDIGRPLPGVRGAKVTTGLLNGTSHRAIHAKWHNIHRGVPGTATFARCSGWTDYIDRTGRFSDRTDVVAIAGDDRDAMSDAINASKKVARRYNDAVVIVGKVPVPCHLSVQGLVNIMTGLCRDIHVTGRLCAVALHDAPDAHKGNVHIHIRATARPVRLEDGSWMIGKGKLIDGPAAMIEWRKRYCALVNNELDREQIPETISPRFYHGTLKDLGIERPAKRRVSASAILRDDPDRSRPQDQFNLEWNRAIDEGRDPNQDSFIIEERKKFAKARAEQRANKDAEAAQKTARRKERIERMPEMQSLRRQLAGMERRTPPPLQPLPEEYVKEVIRTHRKANEKLAPDWAATLEGRAAAEAIRKNVAAKELRARETRERRAEAEAAALREAQRQAEERKRRLADEQAAAEAARNAEEAKHQQEREQREAEYRRKQTEAEARFVVPDARSIVDEVNRAKGLLRAASDTGACKFDGAKGKVAKESDCRTFFSWQSNETLARIHAATQAARDLIKIRDDEYDVLDGGLAYLRHEAERRGIDLTKVLPKATPTPPSSSSPSGRDAAGTPVPQRRKTRGQER